MNAAADNVAAQELLKLGDWNIHPAEGQITRGTETQHLRPKAMAVLCVLVRARGALVTRDELLEEVWGPRAVSDEPLTATIGELRRILGDRRDNRRHIETVPKRGYRIHADLIGPAGIGTDPLEGNRATTVHNWQVALLVVALIIGTAISIFYLRSQTKDALAAKTAIAVLPFTVADANADGAVVGEALSQEILTTLTRFPDLHVAARQSTLAAASYRADFDRLRETLAVDVALDGQLKIEGQRIKIHVQLVDLGAGYNVWAERYERELDQGLALQAEVAMAVANALGVAGTDKKIATDSVLESRSYLDYLRGRYLFENGRSEVELRQAESLLSGIAEKPGSPAEVLTALAGVHVKLADLGYASDLSASYEDAKRLSRRALELSPSNVEAELLLGWISMYGDWDWQQSSIHLAHALDLAPGDRPVLSANAALNYHRGSLERAIRLAQLAVDRDPLSSSAHYNLAYFLFGAGLNERAAETLRRVRSLEPDFPGGGLLEVQLDLHAGAIDSASRRLEIHPILALVANALIAIAKDDTTVARSMLAELTANYSDVAAYQIATVHASLRDLDAAFQWLQVALTLRDPGLAELRVDPLMANLRQDERYRALLSEIGLAENYEGAGPKVL